MKTKPSSKTKFNRTKLILAMSAIVYAIFCISFILISGIYILFYKSPFIDIENLPKNTNIYIYLAISLIIGLVLSIFFRKYVLIPLHESYIALGKVADGKFDIRVNEKGIRSVRKVTKSLNITARELNNLESMRNDFINNFSHEFKTPIVSISGFAKLLKNPELSPQEKEEYLDIIINESERLSQLSANVLNLTRLDNQSILTGISRFNVSEQIRHTVILLENKWSAKNIDITFDSDDYSIFANSELLSQLWINLLDNAIKFSPAKTEIKIAVSQNGSDLIFTFSDQGKGMDENTAKHAFDKFFQGDISHKSNGTGIGLAISKRICELHGGNITIKSTGENGTVFEVIIPIES